MYMSNFKTKKLTTDNKKSLRRCSFFRERHLRGCEYSCQAVHSMPRKFLKLSARMS